MRSKIVLLEDDPDRTAAMLPLISQRLPHYTVVVFDTAPDLIDWLGDHLHEAAILCLDHDLGPNRVRDSQVFDPGTGRDVVDFLAARQPACPVLIHTTNSLAAPGMELALEDSGWTHRRVVPYNELQWIRTAWLPEVEDALTEK
jgi:hypothetical protein